jgi:hypothetical protein
MGDESARKMHSAVLWGALPHFAGRDQQHLVNALESGLQCFWLAVVCLAQLHTQGGEVLGFFWAANSSYDLVGRKPCEQRLNNEAA